jgi:hypothetical protein
MALILFQQIVDGCFVAENERIRQNVSEKIHSTCGTAFRMEIGRSRQPLKELRKCVAIPVLDRVTDFL